MPDEAKCVVTELAMREETLDRLLAIPTILLADSF